MTQNPVKGISAYYIIRSHLSETIVRRRALVLLAILLTSTIAMSVSIRHISALDGDDISFGEQKNNFNEILKDLNKYPGAIPAGGKIDDALKSLMLKAGDTGWSIQWPCPPRTCIVTIKTYFCKWGMAGNHDKKPPNDKGWTYIDNPTIIKNDTHKIFITSAEIELDPDYVASNRNVKPSGQIENVRILYHELLHVQLTINAINNDKWKEAFCRCETLAWPDLLTHHPLIENLQKGLAEWLTAKAEELREKDPPEDLYSTFSTPVTPNTTQIDARSLTDTTITFHPQQEDLLSIVKYNAPPLAVAYPPQCPLKYVDVALIAMGNDTNAVYSDNITWPATLRIFYSDNETSGLDENSLRLYSWDGTQWRAETDYIIDSISNYIEANVNHLYVFVLTAHAPRLRVVNELVEIGCLNRIFQVNITMDELDASCEAIAVQFRLCFNDTILRILDVTEGPFMKQAGDTYFTPVIEVHPIYGPSALVETVLLPNNTGGWNHFPNGSGTLATITFKAISQNRDLSQLPLTCELALRETLIIDSRLAVMRHDTVNGVFKMHPTHIADINYDGKVDVKDIFAVSYAFGSFPGSARWNPDFDFNLDLEIDMRELYITARAFGWTTEHTC